MKEIDLTEFNKLEQMLKKAGILYERVDDVQGTADFVFEFHQLRHPEEYGDKWLWDVICNTGSYGSEEGLLELWGKDIMDPEGYLNAEECLDEIKMILSEDGHERS